MLYPTRLQKIYVIFITLLISEGVLCQRNKIDSVLRVLKTAKPDSSKVILLNKASEELSDGGNYKVADSLAKEAMTLAEGINYPAGEASAYNKAGYVFEDQGNYAGALDNYMQSLKIEQKAGDKAGMSDACMNIGNVYEMQGNYAEALKAQLQALKIAEELGNKSNMGGCYVNVGIIYSLLDNNAEALANYNKGLKIDEEIGNKTNTAAAYLDIGLIYETTGNYTEALKNEMKSLEISKEIKDIRQASNAYSNMGTLYSVMGNYDEAIKNEWLGLEVSKQMNDKQAVGFSYESIGAIYTKQKKYGEAKKFLDSALIVAHSIGIKDIIKSTYYDYAALDSAMGDCNGAYADYKKYISYRDSLKNEENTKKIVSEQMTYEFNKKQAVEKVEQDKKDAIHQEELKKQKIVIYAVTAGLLMALLLTIIIFRSLKQSRKKTQVIEHQKIIVEEKNKEILDSITYAKRLQDAILPPLNLIKKYLPDSFILYRPKDIVAGDFYWMEKAGDLILIAAADCTGHGVPGALVSVICSDNLTRTVKELHITKPGKILDKVRELILEKFERSEGEIKDGMDISLCTINVNTREVLWSGANNPLWYISKGIMNEITADKQPIGRHEKPLPFTTHTLNLNKGDCLYLFTDGYADQFGGPKGKKFKYKQFQEKLVEIASLPMEEQKTLLDEAINNWKGQLEQVDDVLIMGIRV